MQTRCKKRQNFTLLEMIISMFIFSIVVLIIATGIFSIEKTWNVVTKKSEQLNTLRTLDQIFSGSIRNAIPFTWPNTNFVEQSIFVGNSNSVTFAYLHRIISGDQGGIRFITFSLDENGRLIAGYKKTPILTWNNSTQENILTEVIATDISSISFLYASIDQQNNLTWVNQWNTNNPNIPAAIQIEIDFKNGEKERWLRRTAGSGKYESYGQRQYFNQFQPGMQN